MGGGSWDTATYTRYSKTRGRTVTTDGFSSTQNMFTETRINEALNPKNVIRECCDSTEHPNTIPVILALDVTGSMGSACIRTAQSLNKIMETLLKEYKDIEFMIMAIGDLSYDDAPIQASQFESDIRIAEATDKIYFERGGGGNSFESYSAAWYFGLNNCKLDCWNKGRKGIIITMGDEPLNPYLSKSKLHKVLGSNLQEDIDTKQLYEQVKEKYDIYHIGVNDSDNCFTHYEEAIKESFGTLLGQNYIVSTIQDLPKTITDCIKNSIDNSSSFIMNEDNGISNLENGIPVVSW